MTITLQLPIVPEKPEWNLNGQAIPLTLPLTDPVSKISLSPTSFHPSLIF